MSRTVGLTFSDVDRRRTQLWTTSIIVVAAVAVVTVILWLAREALPDYLRLDYLPTTSVLALVGGFGLAFVLYVAEKEASLRRLAAALVEERVRAAALEAKLVRERETVSHLEELDQLKSDFVATVSHELKTPLTAIIGAAKTLSRGPLDDEPRTQFLAMIERQGTRLLRMVEDVLTTARIESGLPQLRREEVDLRGLAESVVAEIRLTRVGLDRDVEVICDGKPIAWGDSGALHRVLGNLVENALKYSSPGMPVKVRVSESEIGATLEVADRGHGIEPDELATIFERFRQIDSSTARPAGGFGLGLFIVKSLVDGHRGHVEVESEVGRGTVFRVRLPTRALENSSRIAR